MCLFFLCCFFFFNDTATTEIYTLSLHDALPISHDGIENILQSNVGQRWLDRYGDRKSTRLNSSHLGISYAVFCLKKKKINNTNGRDAMRVKADTRRAGGTRPLRDARPSEGRHRTPACVDG